MKNNMKLIMESWRESVLKEQGAAHSNDWLSSINVGQFISALESDDNKVLNSKAIERGINAAMKRYAKEIKELEGEEKSKFDALVSKAMSADTVDTLADFAVEQAEDATKYVGAMAGAKVGAMGGAMFGPIGSIAGGLFGGVVGYATSKLVGATAKKGIQIAQNIGGALEDLDVEDQELASTPAFNLIDISDDYKKVIIGADGELDKQEAAVLAIGFKRVAEAYNKILQKQNTIEAMPQNTAQELMDYLQAFSDLMDEPMSNYMDNTATEAARKAYAKMLKLQRNVTINQN
jgi:hypothetical protein